MEGWTIPETITAGSVVVFALVIIYRFLGQRTDPKLLELFELQTNAAAKRDEDNSKDNERLAEALDRNTEALNMVKSGVGSFARSIEQMVSSISIEHQKQLVAIGGIPGAIIPTIETMTQQLADQKGNVQQMNNTIEDQSDDIKKILNAVLRLETRVETIANNFDIFQSESKKLGGEIEETRKEITAIKSDVANLKPIETKPEGKEEKKE